MPGTVAALLDAARSEIGTVESPPNSNRTEYAAEARHANGYPWCATFAVAMAQRAGVTLPTDVADTAYTPSAVNAWKAAGRWHPAPAPGDFAYFQFDGDPQVDHVGIVEAIHPDGTITCIEGNTSPDSTGSQSNGGGVWRRKRNRSLVVGYGRPEFAPTPPAPTPGDDDMPWTDTDSANLAAVKKLLEQINHHVSAPATSGGRLARITAAVEALVRRSGS